MSMNSGSSQPRNEQNSSGELSQSVSLLQKIRNGITGSLEKAFYR